MRVRNISLDKKTLRRARDIFRWIFGRAKGYYTVLLLYILLGAAASILGILYVWFFKEMVDIATGAVAGTIYTAIFQIAAVLAGQAILQAVSSMMIVRVVGSMTNRAKQQAFDALLHSKWIQLCGYHSGDLLTRISSDTGTVVNLLTSVVPGILTTVVRLAAAFGTMLVLDPLVALVSLSASPIILVIGRLYVKKMKGYNREYQQASAANNSFVQESLQNAFVIKAFGVAGSLSEKLAALQERQLGIAVKRGKVGVASSITMSLGFSAGYLLAFLLGAWRLSAGMITFGTMTAFLQLISQVQAPVLSLSSMLPSFVTAYVSAERLIEITSLDKEEAGSPQRLAEPVGISLEEVDCGYTPENPVLQNATVRIPPGETTAVVGETGAGKTTFVRLLLAFLSPEKGAVYLENGESRVAGGVDTRCNFAFVPQGNTVFSGTVRENLLLANPESSPEQLRTALRCACAEFVYGLPDGLDTYIQEKGAGLSEGQAQRIAIARALLRDAPVMLFDEATSALDEETQAQVFANIRACYQSKTLIFITHKLSMAESCDNIMEIKNNRCTMCNRR